MKIRSNSMSTTLKVILVLSLLISVIVAGCIDNKPKQQPVQTGLTGELKIDGAVTNYQMSDKIAKEFMKANPGINIIVRQSNATSGLEKLLAGEIDIADSTRPPKDSEYEIAKNKGITLHQTTVAYNAIVIIIHPSNPASDISMKQLRDIYFDGNITDWGQLTNGTKKGKINIYNTDPKKVGTPLVFNKKVAGSDNAKYVEGITLFNSLLLMDPAIANDTDGIGIRQFAGIGSGVKVIKVNGVNPAKQTILDTTYPLGSELYMITNGPPKGLAKDFINYVFSRDGQRIAEEEGFVGLI